jgi:hypothetical protein
MMESWQQDWVKSLETVADNVDQFFQEVSREIGEVAEALIQLPEEVTEEIERAMGPSLDQLDEQLTEWFAPILEAIAGLEPIAEFNFSEELFIPEAPQCPSACVGCRHYHGQIYGGNLLVCGMHPYGPGEGVEDCADKELFG